MELTEVTVVSPIHRLCITSAILLHGPQNALMKVHMFKFLQRANHWLESRARTPFKGPLPATFVILDHFGEPLSQQSTEVLRD
eukprot:1768819-Amphidinium_carterae.1